MDEKTHFTGEPKSGTYGWVWLLAGATVAAVAITVWFLFHSGTLAVIVGGILFVIIAAIVLYLQRNGQQPMPIKFPVEKADCKDDSSDLR